ncbi:unnamed protein product [Parascedosporium putredinis]|uniref:F-box domain-containing protein n=1 Tax=Parascedosporium putredinis TaxID=1442378 RepID=A0A9P1H203_9PEZI|nr:unnamed protein product [Parascedosporium putredinis]CAI7995656.1 unnamed protein product [Parascedosporium putredinis]
MNLHHLPVEIMLYIADYLDPNDIFQFSLTCKSLQYPIFNWYICRTLLLKYAPFSPEALAASREVDYSRAFRTLWKRRRATRMAQPYAAALMATEADSYIYTNGVLCYTAHRSQLRIRDIRSSSTHEVVINVQSMLSSVPERLNLRKFQFYPIYHAHGILCCIYSSSYIGSTVLLVLRPTTSEIVATCPIPLNQHVVLNLETKQWLSEVSLGNIRGREVGRPELSQQHVLPLPESGSCYFSELEDHRWRQMEISKDECTGHLGILELRREFLAQGYRSRRTCYRQRIYMDSPSRSSPSDRPDLLHTYRPDSNLPRSYRMPEAVDNYRDSHSNRTIHHGDTSETEPSFPYHQCFIRSYFPFCQSFVDLVSSSPRESGEPCNLRLRIMSSQRRWASRHGCDDDLIPSDTADENSVRFWPPERQEPGQSQGQGADSLYSGDYLSLLNEVLNPSGYSGEVDATVDYSSIVQRSRIAIEKQAGTHRANCDCAE